MSNTSILVVEDQQIIRLGLRLILAEVPGLEIVGEVIDGRSAIDAVARLHPTVVLMDIGLPIMDGIESTRSIKLSSPETKIVMFTSRHDDEEIFAAFSAGADAYCLKDNVRENLIPAITAVVENGGWLDPSIASRVLRNAGMICAASAAASAALEPRLFTEKIHAQLSNRELEVLALLVEGNTNQGIATRLTVSNETIKSHMRHIMQKLAVPDRTQAALKAVRNHLV